MKWSRPHRVATWPMTTTRCPSHAERHVIEEAADARDSLPPALPARIGPVQVLPPSGVQLGRGHPVALPVVTLAQPPVIQHRDRRAGEGHRGRLGGPGQVRAEHRGDPVAATPPSQLTGLHPALFGQLAGQPAGGASLLVVHGRGVGLKDQPDGHQPTLRGAAGGRTAGAAPGYMYQRRFPALCGGWGKEIEKDRNAGHPRPDPEPVGPVSRRRRQAKVGLRPAPPGPAGHRGQPDRHRGLPGRAGGVRGLRRPALPPDRVAGSSHRRPDGPAVRRRLQQGAGDQKGGGGGRRRDGHPARSDHRRPNHEVPGVRQLLGAPDPGRDDGGRTGVRVPREDGRVADGSRQRAGRARPRGARHARRHDGHALGGPAGISGCGVSGCGVSGCGVSGCGVSGRGGPSPWWSSRRVR